MTINKSLAFLNIFLAFFFFISVASAITAPQVIYDDEGTRATRQIETYTPAHRNDFSLTASLAYCKEIVGYCHINVDIDVGGNPDEIKYAILDDSKGNCSDVSRYRTLSERDVHSIKKYSRSASFDISLDYKRDAYACLKVTVDTDRAYSSPIKLESFGARRGQQTLGGVQKVDLLREGSLSKQNDKNFYIEILDVVCDKREKECDVNIKAYAKRGFKANGIKGSFISDGRFCSSRESKYRIELNSEVEDDDENVRDKFVLKERRLGRFDGKIFCVFGVNKRGKTVIEKSLPISFDNSVTQARYLFNAGVQERDLKENADRLGSEGRISLSGDFFSGRNDDRLDDEGRLSRKNKIGGDFFSDTKDDEKSLTFDEKQRKIFRAESVNTSAIRAPSVDGGSISVHNMGLGIEELKREIKRILQLLIELKINEAQKSNN